jgi:putative component of membrane protein insertase Oxa1/YidC/SpoIIIJ protein YidD
VIRASLVLVCGLAGCAAPARSSPCAAPGFAPWDAAPSRAAAPVSPSGVADGLVAAYQRWLRRPTLPGAGCPFHPTCSAYARQVLDRWGPLGLVLVFDRLFVREHVAAGARYPTACTGGHTRWHDPAP